MANSSSIENHSSLEIPKRAFLSTPWLNKEGGRPTPHQPPTALHNKKKKTPSKVLKEHFLLLALGFSFIPAPLPQLCRTLLPQTGEWSHCPRRPRCVHTRCQFLSRRTKHIAARPSHGMGERQTIGAKEAAPNSMSHGAPPPPYVVGSAAWIDPIMAQNEQILAEETKKFGSRSPGQFFLVFFGQNIFQAILARVASAGG